MQGMLDRSTLTVAIMVNRRHDLKPDLDIAHELDKKTCGYMATKHDLPK